MVGVGVCVEVRVGVTVGVGVRVLVGVRDGVVGHGFAVTQEGHVSYVDP